MVKPTFLYGKDGLSYIGNRWFKILLVSFIALFMTILFTILPVYDNIYNIVYDAYMRGIKSRIKESPQLLLIDIDDNTLNQPYINYSWPWPRFIFGDAVEIIADAGAKAVVFDIEFLGRSASGVNKDEFDKAVVGIGRVFQSVNDDFKGAIGALQIQPVMLNDPLPLISGFESNMNNYYYQVDQFLNKVIEDNDRYFAKRLRYFGRSYGTVNITYSPGFVEDTSTDEYKRQQDNLKRFGIRKDLLLKKGQTNNSLIHSNTADFPLDEISSAFRRVGFTAVKRDDDSRTRNIALFMEKDSYIIPQLSLSPLLDIYNIKDTDIDLSHKNAVVLKNVNINGEISDINIPLYKGMMRINWPHGEYKDIFLNSGSTENGSNGEHFSFARLAYYKSVLIKNFELSLRDLSTIDDDDFSAAIKNYELYKKSKEIMVESGSTLGEEERGAMNEYFDIVLQNIISLTAKDAVEKRLSSIVGSGLDTEQMETIKSSVALIMENCNRAAEEIVYHKNIIDTSLKDKICFIGLTATGTHDMGSTPFDSSFENVGTHPSVFNTIISKQFITMVPGWVTLFFASFYFMLISFFLIGRRAIVTVFVGVLSVVAAVLITMPFYRFLNVYISPVGAVVYTTFGIISIIIMEFILSEKDKQYIRSTFDRYLSPVVINDLIKNGKQIELGGERRNCSAMFTDIESFSSFSERFMDDPKGLVALLNGYLSAMSDIIMEHGGTIDKYEGDAIIAFFGAPLSYDNHPFRACLSSIRMKEAESNLNAELIAKGLIDKPIFTRIGINTGDMFVGNMGTYNRLEYTMIGHAVNLAARLEGVNKQYSTYQLISEYTYSKVSDAIFARKLDRVRVVNIKTPIRLYELIGLTDEVKSDIKDGVGLFHRGLELFENMDFKEALKVFGSIKINDNFDRTTIIYIERCKKFIETPPPDNWDGVYNLSMK